MRTTEYLNLVWEAENSNQFAGNKVKAWKAVGEKLFNIYWNDKTGMPDPTKFSLTEMLAGHLRHDLKDPSISLYGPMGQAFLHEYDGDPRASEAVVSGAFPTITGTIVEKTIIKNYELVMEDYRSLYSEHQWTGGSTVKATIPGVYGSTAFKKRPEGTPYQATDLKEKYVEIQLADFGRTVSLTWEAVVTDRTGLIMESAQSVGKGGAQHQSKMIIQSIEMVAARTTMGETATLAYVANGTTLTQATVYANTHAAVTGLDGQVNDNVVTTDTALGVDGLVEACSLLGIMVSDSGEEIIISPTTILTHTNKYITAIRLIGSEYEPFTTENQINPFKNKYTIVATPFLSDTNSWYFGDFPTQIVWLWVDKPQSITLANTTQVFFDSKTVRQWRFSYHGGCGQRDYRHIVRSPGES